MWRAKYKQNLAQVTDFPVKYSILKTFSMINEEKQYEYKTNNLKRMFYLFILYFTVIKNTAQALKNLGIEKIAGSFLIRIK